MWIYCPKTNTDQLTVTLQGQYVCRGCGDGEGDQDSLFHGIPVDHCQWCENSNELDHAMCEILYGISEY